MRKLNIDEVLEENKKLKKQIKKLEHYVLILEIRLRNISEFRF